MKTMKQYEIEEKLCELFENEHAGCDQNTCDMSVAFRLEYECWALYLFNSSGAASEEFATLYSKLGPRFHKTAEKQCTALCKEDNFECKCGAVIWLPEECGYHCESCGETNDKPKQGAK